MLTHTISLFATRYNEKADVYSFAITLLEIACGDYRYVKDQSRRTNRYAATAGEYTQYPHLVTTSSFSDQQRFLLAVVLL